MSTKIAKLNPIFDSLVIEQFEAKKTTESGIIIPESSQKKPSLARVLAVGPTCKSGIKEGNLIVIPKNMQIMTEVEVDGDIQCIIKEENVIAVVEVLE